jgi:hypothetical protein
MFGVGLEMLVGDGADVEAKGRFRPPQRHRHHVVAGWVELGELPVLWVFRGCFESYTNRVEGKGERVEGAGQSLARCFEIRLLQRPEAKEQLPLSLGGRGGYLFFFCRRKVGVGETGVDMRAVERFDIEADVVAPRHGAGDEAGRMREIETEGRYSGVERDLGLLAPAFEKAKVGWWLTRECRQHGARKGVCCNIMIAVGAEVKSLGAPPLAIVQEFNPTSQGGLGEGVNRQPPDPHLPRRWRKRRGNALNGLCRRVFRRGKWQFSARVGRIH